jgi:hypothetical protein
VNADPLTHFRTRMRDAVATTLTNVFADEPRFEGLIEGGSAATGRLDQHSDIDFGAIAPPELHDRVFAVVEAAAAAVDSIAQVYPVIESPWAGLTQRFYLFDNAPPFFMLDFWVAPRAAAEPFLERERHGEPLVLFDRHGSLRSRPMDGTAHAAKMARRRAHIKSMWPVMRKTLDKDLVRGRWLDAYGFYSNGLLRPLTELAGMRHRPERFDFGWRYLHYDLPPDLVSEFFRLAYVGSPEALRAALPAADALARRLLDETAHLA